MYNGNDKTKFITLMLKLSLCEDSDAYILVKGTISVANAAVENVSTSNTGKKTLKLCST